MQTPGVEQLYQSGTCHACESACSTHHATTGDIQLQEKGKYRHVNNQTNETETTCDISKHKSHELHAHQRPSFFITVDRRKRRRKALPNTQVSREHLINVDRHRTQHDETRKVAEDKSNNRPKKEEHTSHQIANPSRYKKRVSIRKAHNISATLVINRWDCTKHHPSQRREHEERQAAEQCQEKTKSSNRRIVGERKDGRDNEKDNIPDHKKGARGQPCEQQCWKVRDCILPGVPQS